MIQYKPQSTGEPLRAQEAVAGWQGQVEDGSPEGCWFNVRQNGKSLQHSDHACGGVITQGAPSIPARKGCRQASACGRHSSESSTPEAALLGWAVAILSIFACRPRCSGGSREQGDDAEKRSVATGRGDPLSANWLPSWCASAPRGLRG